MNNKVTKISKLKNTESFMQLNYIRGHKYVDKAGEFINELYDGDVEPVHALTPEGGRIRLNEKEEVKVSPKLLWMHFIEPNSFEVQKQSFLKIFEKVNRLFSPGKYKRIGWRIHLVLEYVKEPKIIGDKIFEGSFENLTFKKKINNIDSKIIISNVINTENDQKAILIDIDFYKNIDSENIDITKLVSDIYDAISSKELLDIINKILF